MLLVQVPIPSYLIAIVVGLLESREIGPRSRVWSEKEVVDAAAQEFSEVRPNSACAHCCYQHCTLFNHHLNLGLYSSQQNWRWCENLNKLKLFFLPTFQSPQLTCIYRFRPLSCALGIITSQAKNLNALSQGSERCRSMGGAR